MLVKEKDDSEREANSSRFLNAFNKIEKYLRKKAQKGREADFATLLRAAAIISDIPVKYYENDLREFADLRNAIVHETTDCHVIAEPNDRATLKIEQIADRLTMPPKLMKVATREVYRFQVTDPISKPVELMRNKSISQVPIYNNSEFVALLSTNTIARWLADCIKDDNISLHDTPIKRVLLCTEDKNNYGFLSKDATAFEALKLFENNQTEKANHK